MKEGRRGVLLLKCEKSPISVGPYFLRGTHEVPSVFYAV